MHKGDLAAVVPPAAKLVSTPPRALDNPHSIANALVKDHLAQKEGLGRRFKDDEIVAELYVFLAVFRTPPNTLDVGSCFDPTALVGLFPCNVASRKGLKGTEAVDGLEIPTAVVLGTQVLLNHNGSIFEAGRTQTFQESKHTGAEEYFGKTKLVLVSPIILGLTESLSEDVVAHLPNLCGPLCRWNEHVVPERKLLVHPSCWVTSTADADSL